MNKTSLVMCLVLGSVWTVGCGDDGGSDEPLLPDASTDDAASEDDTATGDNTATDDDNTATTDDTAVEDDVTSDDDDPTDEEITSDDDEPTTDDETLTDDDATISDDGTGVESEAGVSDDGVDAGTPEPVEGGVTDEDSLDGGSDDESDEPTDDTDVAEPGVDASADGGEVSEGVEIGSAGGSVEGFGAVLQIPANSISTPSLIQVEEVTASNTDGLVSLTWDFSPDGLTFDPPAQLTLPFDVAAAGGADVVIAWLDGDTWVPLTDCVTTDDEITCPVSHFTTFGVVLAEEETGSGDECNWPPCALEIDLEGCLPDEVETCQLIGGQSPSAMNLCFENGVKAQITNLTSDPVTMSFKNSAGGACYSMEITGALTGNNQYTWRNASGAAVMTGHANANTPDIVTYTCDGTDYVVDYSTPECAGEPRPASSDTEGCTFSTCQY